MNVLACNWSPNQLQMETKINNNVSSKNYPTVHSLVARYVTSPDVGLRAELQSRLDRCSPDPSTLAVIEILFNSFTTAHLHLHRSIWHITPYWVVAIIFEWQRNFVYMWWKNSWFGLSQGDMRKRCRLHVVPCSSTFSIYPTSHSGRTFLAKSAEWRLLFHEYLRLILSSDFLPLVLRCMWSGSMRIWNLDISEAIQGPCSSISPKGFYFFPF